jgi:2-phosphoglycerate kinase
VPERRRLVVTRERSFPYSKGLLAQSLMACGLPPDRAYRIARIVEVDLRRGDRDLVTTEDLRRHAVAVLAREEGAEAVDRYRRFNALAHLPAPLIVAIGGAPGAGKSTIATQVAHRLGITRIVSTDVVRQVLRGVLGTEGPPAIHRSSFDAGIAGFRDQVDALSDGLRTVVARAAAERYPMVLEGVHLAPDLRVVVDDASVTYVPVVLVVGDEERHRANFELRAEHTADGRPAERYLGAFGAIRELQGHLADTAVGTGVPTVEASHVDGAVRAVLDLVLARVALAG